MEGSCWETRQRSHPQAREVPQMTKHRLHLFKEALTDLPWKATETSQVIRMARAARVCKRLKQTYHKTNGIK